MNYFLSNLYPLSLDAFPSLKLELLHIVFYALFVT